MPTINWNEQFKIRTTDCKKERDKHEVCKLLLLRKLIRKHKHEKQYIKIYTEFEVKEGVIADLYYENYKSKEIVAYEIQKNMKKEKEKIKKYKEWEVMFFKTDLIIINLNKLSNNVKEMEEQLEDYVF